MTEVVLYHNAMSTCSQKVRLALEEKALAWQSREINLIAGEHKSKEYMLINPRGVVPALMVDGTVILESTLINEFIEESFSGPALLPEGPAARALARLWPKRIDEGVHSACGVLTYGTVMRSVMLQMPREFAIAEINKVQDEGQRQVRLSLFEHGTRAPDFESSLKLLVRFLDDLDVTLEDKPWLGGNEFGLADCAAAPYVLRFDHLGLERLWASGQRPHLGAWYAALVARPAFSKAVSDWVHPPAIQMFGLAGAEVAERLSEIG